jgi:HEAT repeat protein
LAWLLAVALVSSALSLEHAPAEVAFTAPGQFLVDKETDLAALVTVTRAETRWIILPDGDHVPLVVANCRMEEVLSGSAAWPPGSHQPVSQFDYTDLIFEPIAPPVIPGRRYLLWAAASPEDGELQALAPWTAHPQGFLLIRGGREEFVFWNGRNYSVPAIRRLLASGERLALDQIADPARRLRVAEERMRRARLGDEQAFIRGLLVNVVDAEGQAKRVEPSLPSPETTDVFGMAEGSLQPHALWYGSLAMLRDLGRDEKRRQMVVAALVPIAQSARPPIRLAAALALVDLGSDAGRAALVQGFESESGPISSDPPDTMTFPGRYPYDDSSVTACAHALARLGDRRGLAHAKAEVRLAAAEALKDAPDPDLRTALEGLAASLEAEVDQLRADGKLSEPRRPGDYTNRYPENWVRARAILARLGDDESLRRLVEAYLTDAATYAAEVEAPLVPTGRPTTWSTGPSPGQAIPAADPTPSRLLARLERLFTMDPRWESPAFQSLRESIDGTATQEREPAARPEPGEAEIAKLLGDSDPDQRAQGLAAAGYHQIAAFYERVLDVALHGAGVERQAALYAVGFYGREVPEPTLRQLLTSDSAEVRFAAFELATRRDGARFARESMDFVRTLLKDAPGQPSRGQPRELAHLTRILARLARGPLPAALLDGLQDPDPGLRRLVAGALELGGNPDAVPYLVPLLADPDAATRQAAQSAIERLGPAPTR